MRKKIVVIYLPTEADVKHWQTLARGKSSSLSSWVFETVENSLNRPPPKPVTNTEELSSLRKEVHDLKQENAQLLTLNSRLIETRKADADTIPRIKLLEEAVKGLLQKGGTWSDKRLRKAMETPKEPYLNELNNVDMAFEKNVDSAFEINLITRPLPSMKLNVLSKVMHNLIDEGLVEELVGGYRWKGKS